MEQKNKGSCITFWMRGRRSAQPAPKTWCSTTKEQGLAGSEAPRQVRRRRLGPQRRGDRRRRNKVLRGAEHHVRYVGGALSSEDVVLDDERTRACGRRSTTSGTPAGPRALGRRPSKKDRRTVGPPNFPNLPNLLNLSGVPKYPARPSIRFTQVFPYFTFRVFVVFQLDCSFFWILACSCQVRAKCSRPLESDWK